MAAHCCTGAGPSRSRPPRLPGILASVLPGIPLVLLPKCPLCLAGWLALTTGISLSAPAAEWLREGVLLVSLAGVVFGVVWMSGRPRPVK